MRRRVLVVSSVPLAAPWNGADKNLSRLLVRRDRNNDFVVQTDLKEVWPDARRVIAIRSRSADEMPTAVQKLRAFAYLLRHTGAADLIHVVASLYDPPRLTGTTVRAWSDLRRKPVLHTVPSVGDAPIRRADFFGDATVVVSEYTRRLLVESGVLNVFRITPPLEAEDLRPRDPHSPEALRRELKLGDRAVLYPTHYGEKSGIPEVIQAFSRLRGDARMDDAVLVLALRAHAWQDAKAEEQKTLSLAAKAKILGRVRLLREVTDMPALISSCAVTALVPDRLGGKMDLPLTILESLALGRPVVVSDRPPINEALLGGGYAVPYGDVPALGAAISRLLRDSQLRRGLAEQGRVAALKACAPHAVIEQYQRIYEWMMAPDSNETLRRGTPQRGPFRSRDLDGAS